MKLPLLEILATVSLGVIAVVCAITLGPPVDWSAVNVVEWVSAIGTVGAVVIAVVLSTAGERRRRTEALMLAKMKAISLCETLRLAQTHLQVALMHLEERKGDSNFNAIHSWVAASSAPEIENVEVFVPLPRNCAARLFVALDTLRSQATHLHKVKKYWTEQPPAGRELFSKNLRESLSRANDHMCAVHAEFCGIRAELIPAKKENR